LSGQLIGAVNVGSGIAGGTVITSGAPVTIGLAVITVAVGAVADEMAGGRSINASC